VKWTSTRKRTKFENNHDIIGKLDANDEIILNEKNALDISNNFFSDRKIVITKKGMDKINKTIISEAATVSTFYDDDNQFESWIIEKFPNLRDIINAEKE